MNNIKKHVNIHETLNIGFFLILNSKIDEEF